MNAFNCMPMAALIGGRIFACHGGISPEIEVPKDVDKVGSSTGQQFSTRALVLFLSGS